MSFLDRTGSKRLEADVQVQASRFFDIMRAFKRFGKRTIGSVDQKSEQEIDRKVFERHVNLPNGL